MTIKELLIESSKKLKKFEFENPMLSARILLSSLLDKPKEYFVTHGDENINENIQIEFKQNIEKLISGIPIQYITNKQEFMGLNFFVDKNVLIPRQDTEILVQEVIDICKNINKEKIKILDLCTGSGAIAVSIAKYVHNAEVYASDISPQALKVANINSKNNDVFIKFIESNLFKKINERFDIIVSNPPYIKTNVIPMLDENVQNEPKLALDGGIDGLHFYRKIIEQCNKYLNENGIVCLEIGYDQKEDVIKIASNYFKQIYSKKDLAGNDRIVVAK